MNSSKHGLIMASVVLTLAALALLAACGSPGPTPVPSASPYPDVVEPAALSPADYQACREQVERVYHSHRTDVPPFEQAYAGGIMATRTTDELHKERLLRDTFSVTPSPKALTDEMRRIDQTTQAPEILAEIKAALGGDVARMLTCLVKPIVVDASLRDAFANSTSIHAARRAEAEALLQRAKAGEDFATVAGDKLRTQTYLLGSPTQAPPGDPLTPQPRLYTMVPAEIRAVLDAQLLQPGDISEVISTSDAFVIFRLNERTADRVVLDIIVVPKLTFEEWYTQQP
jgi:predicted small lipoprotein YifL